MPETFAFQQPFSSPVYVSTSAIPPSPPTQTGPVLGGPLGGIGPPIPPGTPTPTAQKAASYDGFTRWAITAWSRLKAGRTIAGTSVPWIAIWFSFTMAMLMLAAVNEPFATQITAAVFLGQILQAAVWKG